MNNSDATKINDFVSRSLTLKNNILANKLEIVEILLNYETYETVLDEIERSIETLDGAKREIEQITNRLDDLVISTFFPLNLPLYSLILFGIMPSAFSKQVFIRPPELMFQTLKSLCQILGIENLFPEISLFSVKRNIFLELYAKDSDAIIFTGKYENALNIHSKCPNALMLYNGSGVNPFIIFKDADIELAVDKAIEMRCFNSGQDCAGPDAFIIDAKIKDEFINKLKNKIKLLKVGSTQDKKTNISKTIKQSYIIELEAWINKNKQFLLIDTKIDKENNLVYPAISYQTVADFDGVFHEFFAPFFNVISFKSETELENLLNLESFKERGMYVSVFGNNNNIEKNLDCVKILKNKIVNDTEKGNDEYGGYGSKSNFLLLGDRSIVQPVLISRDLHKMLA